MVRATLIPVTTPLPELKHPAALPEELCASTAFLLARVGYAIKLTAMEEFERSGNELTVRGEIAIKGQTHPIELTGTIGDPIADPYGSERFGLELEGKIDRTAFGIDWNTPLPTGEPALANEVTLVAQLQLVKAA